MARCLLWCRNLLNVPWTGNVHEQLTNSYSGYYSDLYNNFPLLKVPGDFEPIHSIWTHIDSISYQVHPTLVATELTTIIVFVNWRNFTCIGRCDFDGYVLKEFLPGKGSWQVSAKTKPQLFFKSATTGFYSTCRMKVQWPCLCLWHNNCERKNMKMLTARLYCQNLTLSGEHEIVFSLKV